MMHRVSAHMSETIMLRGITKMINRRLSSLEFVLLKNDIGNRKHIKLRRGFNRKKNKLKKKHINICVKIIQFNFLKFY